MARAHAAAMRCERALDTSCMKDRSCESSDVLLLLLFVLILDATDDDDDANFDLPPPTPPPRRKVNVDIITGRHFVCILLPGTHIDVAEAKGEDCNSSRSRTMMTDIAVGMAQRSAGSGLSRVNIFCS